MIRATQPGLPFVSSTVPGRPDAQLHVGAGRVQLERPPHHLLAGQHAGPGQPRAGRDLRAGLEPQPGHAEGDAQDPVVALAREQAPGQDAQHGALRVQRPVQLVAVRRGGHRLVDDAAGEKLLDQVAAVQVIQPVRPQGPGRIGPGWPGPPAGEGVTDQVVSTRIDWVREHCRLLRVISAEFRQTRPFGGLTIGTGIHLEAKTVGLLLTLRDGGARLVSTGNLNTTQPDAVETLRAEGITVIGGPTRDTEVHAGYLDEVLAAKPGLILDNGGDLFARYLDRPYEGLLGGTEETTSGRMRLEPLRGKLKRPILVINDSPIKQFAENEHAVGQSALESFLRMTNRVTNGEQVTVFG